MSTTLHSFMDIFETTIEDGDTSVQLMVFTEMMMIALRIPLLFLKMKRVLIRKIESLS